ncbi:MAG TPA: hypothetical protein VFD72_00975, partial [Sphingobacteriaceae bacterium]|nr:hypothetical protein [Sphingobacteriaceae bacterium]
YKISNLTELRQELQFLKAQAREQEVYLSEQYDLLKKKVDAPVRFVNNLVSWIPGVDVAKELISNKSGKGEGDWVSRIFSAGSASILNRLFLRRAGFVKRILLTAITQQTASLMNQDRAVNAIKWLADVIRGKNDPESEPPTDELEHDVKKKRKFFKENKRKTTNPVAERPDFGIPPLSETS